MSLKSTMFACVHLSVCHLPFRKKASSFLSIALVARLPVCPFRAERFTPLVQRQHLQSFHGVSQQLSVLLAVVVSHGARSPEPTCHVCAVHQCRESFFSGEVFAAWSRSPSILRQPSVHVLPLSLPRQVFCRLSGPARFRGFSPLASRWAIDVMRIL